MSASNNVSPNAVFVSGRWDETEADKVGEWGPGVDDKVGAVGPIAGPYGDK